MNTSLGVRPVVQHCGWCPGRFKSQAKGFESGFERFESGVESYPPLSTGDLLSYLTHTWSSSLRNFRGSFVVALDKSKAFDRVWHKAPLVKVLAYGFTPSFCKLRYSFLFNLFISIVSFPVSSGVP